jgi:hypothetical protein
MSISVLPTGIERGVFAPAYQRRPRSSDLHGRRARFKDEVLSGTENADLCLVKTPRLRGTFRISNLPNRDIPAFSQNGWRIVGV